MKISRIVLLVGVALVGPSCAVAQTAPTRSMPSCLQFLSTGLTIPCTGVVPVDTATGNPINWTDLFDRARGSGGPGNSVADSTAANQLAQITVATSIKDRIGDVTSPAPGSVNARLSNLQATLSGTLTVAPHGVTQSGSWTTSLTGSLPAFASTPTVNVGSVPSLTVGSSVLPTGAATDAKLDAVIAKLNGTLSVSQSSLPAFSATPTVNIGTASTLSTVLKDSTGTTVGTSTNPLYVTGGGSGGGASVPTGPAGTPNSAVVSVQGIAGGTALPVSLANVPLATGAATDTTVAAIGAKLPTTLGVKASVGSLSVVPATDSSFPVTGTVSISGTPTVNIGTAPTLTVNTHSVTQSGTWNTGVTSLPALAAGTNTIGSVNVNGTVPVSGTFYQATQPVSLASVPLPTGAVADTTVSAMSAKLPATLGAKTAATSLSVAPATDASFLVTGSVGISGTLPAFASTPTVNLGTAPTLTVGTHAVTQSGSWNVGVTSLPALSTGTNTIGAVNVNGTVPVSGNVAISNLPATQTVTGSVSVIGTTAISQASGSVFKTDTVVQGTAVDRGAVVSTSAIQLIPANTNRRGFTIQNQSPSAACYINATGTATTDYHSLQIAAGGYYESSLIHVNTGAISIVCSDTNVSVYAREF